MQSGIRHDDLRRNNRALVLGAVRRMGQPSRTALAEATGFSHSTISAMSAGLIAEGTLREVPRDGGGGATRRGRPQVAIALDPEAGSVIVGTLALNHLSAALVDYAGQTIVQASKPLTTLSATREALGEGVSSLIATLCAQAPTPVLRVVLAIQGIVDRGGRSLVWTPITPVTDLAFAALIERQTGIPTRVENDCSMMASALLEKPGSRRGRDFAVVLHSHGIGMGLVTGGTVFSGTQSSGAEFGHIIHRPGGALCRCGKRGCVEAYAGSYAILRYASGSGEDAPPATSVSEAEIASLAERARASDARAREAFERAGLALGTALGSLFALVDPLPVTFVGANTVAFDLIKPALRQGLQSTAGGARAGNLAFAVEADEMPLIRQGATLSALDYLDREVFSVGTMRQKP